MTGAAATGAKPTAAATTVATTVIAESRPASVGAREQQKVRGRPKKAALVISAEEEANLTIQEQ